MRKKIQLPLSVKILNAAGKTFRLPRPLDPDTLIRKARRKTGLDDFGDESFYPALCKLVESAKEEANLSPLGWLVLNIRLGTILCNNLRTRQILKKHPEILQADLDPPVFITGLQRTGTTFLQRILASDSGTRPVYSWEGLNPVPHVKFKGREERISETQIIRDINSRISKAKVSAAALRLLSPAFYTIHPVQYDGPEEDVLLMDHSFISTVAEATMHVPGYSRWLEKQDQTPSYNKLLELLKVLQWQSRGNRWILKTPHHMEWLDYLFRTFPDARVIMTHRDPVTCMASFASMIFHSWSILSDSVDPAEVGRQWFPKVRRMVARAMEFRKPDDKRFFDVSYYDLIADPQRTAAGIYSFLDIPMGEGVRRGIENLVSANSKNRYGRHTYYLEDFGIGIDEAESAFSAYCDRFSIRNEYSRNIRTERK